ncbi:MAG TPA: SRPBCC family protein [Solirubrobacteraceae bacterium]|jgi:ribosome-associated toxin RatA of RatAB toxin-antitoxin module|nr:SRPBCC family protein [Solirubrobacteraceae bacterium]
MSHHVIEASAHSNASREAVWALVRDIETWQDWGTWSSTTVHQPAPGDDPQGVGVVRRLRQAPVTNLERVTELVPNERLSYELVEGLPFENYHATVQLADGAAGGTDITWRAEFDVTAKVRGNISRKLLERFYPQIVEKLARGAERGA